MCMLCILFNTKKTEMHTPQNDRNDLFANTLSLALLDSQWEIIYKNKRGFDRSRLKYPDPNCKPSF